MSDCAPYRPRVGFYPLLYMTLHGFARQTLLERRSRSLPNRTYENPSRPAAAHRRRRHRRSPPLPQIRQGSHGLHRAHRHADPLRQGVSRHGAAQLPEARAVPGRAQGARQPAGARDGQEHALRPQGSGVRVEEHRGGCAVQARRGRRARAQALRLLQRHAGHGAGDRRGGRSGAAPGRSGSDARSRARVPRLPDPPGRAHAEHRAHPRRSVGVQRAGRRRMAR